MTVVVGVSGGADSLALWHALSAGGLHPVTHLVAASLDHGLREEAAADVAFVRDLAERSGAVYHTGRVDVPALARARGESLEEAARNARYAFFADVARAVGARHIATAHNADDQAETVLLHLLRGSGLAGLQGMLPSTPLPGAPDLVLLRPLLSVPRAVIDDYCAAHGLSARLDASNLDTALLRNRVRHDLLPALETINPRLRQGLLRLATLVAGDEALLAELTAEALTGLVASGPSYEGEIRLRLPGWRALPLSLRRRVLRAAAGRLTTAEIGFATLEQARLVGEEGPAGRRSEMPGGVSLEVGYDWLVMRVGAPAIDGTLPQLPGDGSMRLLLPGAVALAAGWRLEAAPAPGTTADQARALADPWTAFVRLPPERASLQVRGRRPGERMRPLGMGGRSTTIKELMIDRKLPAARRDRWPIVATEEYPIWIAGHTLDDRAAVKGAEGVVWRLACRRDGDGPTPSAG